MGGCWSPTRSSAIFVITEDGVLDYWDLIYQQRQPILSTKVSTEPLHVLSVHHEGTLVAVGGHRGNTTLVQVGQD